MFELEILEDQRSGNLNSTHIESSGLSLPEAEAKAEAEAEFDK